MEAKDKIKKYLCGHDRCGACAGRLWRRDEGLRTCVGNMDGGDRADLHRGGRGKADMLGMRAGGAAKGAYRGTTDAWKEIEKGGGTGT